jgi:hypothetical protein
MGLKNKILEPLVFFCSGLGFEGAKSIYDDIDHSIFAKLQVRTIVELFQHHH